MNLYRIEYSNEYDAICSDVDFAESLDEIVQIYNHNQYATNDYCGGSYRIYSPSGEDVTPEGL